MVIYCVEISCDCGGNDTVPALYSEKIFMKPAYLIISMLMIAVACGCGGNSPSKRTEMKNLVEEMPGDERASVQDDFLAKALSLTPEQSLEVGRINRKYAREVDSIVNSTDYRSRKARRFKAAMKNKEQELKKVLSKEQYKKYEQIREEMKRKLMERR